jgi:galactose mutarotase-like enzyme
MTADTLRLVAGDDVATISRRGGEIVSWQVGGRELIWNGDPAYWSGRAPVLFPVVGASSEGQVRVDGRTFPMPQHGFARNLDFDLVEHSESEAVLRLQDSDDTRRHYPFAFRFDIRIRIVPDAVDLRFKVHNSGDRVLPYALGYHPAFPWPFDREDRTGHTVLFDEAETALVPRITQTGLLEADLRPVPMDGMRLPLTPDLFEKNALVFRNARSRRLRFVSPSGAAIALEADCCPHFAVWTKPEAPFLSLEAWTGHADWLDFNGELTDRNSMRLLEPGDSDKVDMRLRWMKSSENST